jgi:outer membrane immunogenic protein
VGARGGLQFMPRVLAYGNIGFTSARFPGTNQVNTFGGAATGFSTPAFTANGWFLGSGAEVAVTPNLFWRSEYRFARYNSQTLTDSNGTVNANFITFKPSVQTVTTQLVYKFNLWR